MIDHRNRLLAGTAAVALAAGLAACGGGGGGGEASGPAKAGGTLHYYIYKPYDYVDPQRAYTGVEMTNWSRTVFRQLVTFPISTDEKEGFTPQPDLATDTGTSSDGGRVWEFTIKDGVKWEDGKAITCEDFKYGASRSFATDVITGGPTYFLNYLDIPTDKKTGLPAYDGPYKGDGQQYFDKAVTCKGNTITYHFKKPWPDFPLAVAALHMADPFRQDKDQGAKSNYMIFSNGPYKVEGNMWDKNKGATFVRNPNYDASTDSPDNRKALPDQIVFTVGQTEETIYDRLIADSGDDQSAVTSSRVPPSYYTQITGAVADRSDLVKSPYIDYLQPDVRNMTDVKVRQALNLATNVTGWINAGGGEKAYLPVESIVPDNLPGYQPDPAFTGHKSGDPEAAKKLLEEAGVKIPYPITFTYQSSETFDKMAAALKETWDKAGFSTTLDGLGATYYDVINKPEKESDVVWAGWGPDWPSAITVTPPLFESTRNLTPTSNGADYGNYDSDKFNSLVAKAESAPSLDQQTKYMQQADLVLGQDVAYIPLEAQNFYWLHGSKVQDFITTPSSNGYPDLGAIGVAQ